MDKAKSKEELENILDEDLKNRYPEFQHSLNCANALNDTSIRKIDPKIIKFPQNLPVVDESSIPKSILLKWY